MNWAMVLFISWPQKYPFPHNCNILPSAKWLSCQWGEECSVFFVLFFFSFPFFSPSAPLPFRVFLWRKHVTEVAVMTPQMSPFVCNSSNSSLNAFTVVACTLWHIQRTECRLSKVKKEPQDVILFPLSRWEMENHSFTFPQRLYL